MKNSRIKKIHHTPSKINRNEISGENITIYGAGIFNEEKLVLNRERAILIYLELHKFLFEK